MQDRGVFYPTPTTEVPFTKGQVIVSKRVKCHGAKKYWNGRYYVFVGVSLLQCLLIMILLRLINMKALYSIFSSLVIEIYSYYKVLLFYTVISSEYTSFLFICHYFGFTISICYFYTL